MARNKNPAALFDVIHSAKKPPRASPSAAIPTPKWWGKGKSLPKPATIENTEKVGKQRSWLSAAKRNGITPVVPASPVETPIEPPVSADPPIAPYHFEITAIEPPAIEQPVAQPVEQAKPRFIDRFKNRQTVEPTIVDEPLAPLPVAVEPLPDAPIPAEIKPERPRSNREPVMSVDSAAGDIRFRLSYAGLVAIGFIFVLLLAIAFIAGRQISSQSAMDDSGFTDDKSATTAPTSGLMAAVGPTNKANSHDSMPVRSDVLTLPPHTGTPAAAANPTTPNQPPLPIKTTRDIGMVYVVVQSYAEQELAQQACDYMNHSGVSCSLVQGPANWAPRDWYSVVGLQPFTKHDASLPEYERAIKALGVKFTPHPMDQFQPQAYTWREDSDLSQ